MNLEAQELNVRNPEARKLEARTLEAMELEAKKLRVRNLEAKRSSVFGSSVMTECEMECASEAVDCVVFGIGTQEDIGDAYKACKQLCDERKR